MRIIHEVHLHYHHDPKLDQILNQQEAILAAIDDLEAAVTAEDAAIAQAIALLNQIPALITAASGDPGRLIALSTDIKNQTILITNALAADTPPVVTPPAPPAPPVEPSA